MANKNLSNAKKSKNDEFYTQWEDIEKEVNAYLEYDRDVFKNKTILLPADDPFESNFFKFFATHFNDFGLKKLIATSYDPSPIVNTQLKLSLFDDPVSNDKTKKISKAYRIEISDLSDFDDDGRININDVEAQLMFEKRKLDSGKKSNILSYLVGDDEFSPGDFRSKEVTKLRDVSDFIITNPPFSLFRDFLKWIVPSKRKFLIIGNINVIAYREVFPLIKDNQIWLGTGIGRWISGFIVPKEYQLFGSEARIEHGKRIVATNNALWLTNIEHGKRHQYLSLMTMEDNIKFSKHKSVNGNQYVKYENYDALEVPYTDSIPSDYNGLMGVPITFLDKYNPDQFQIIDVNPHFYEAIKQGLPKPKQLKIDGKKDPYARILIQKK